MAFCGAEVVLAEEDGRLIGTVAPAAVLLVSQQLVFLAQGLDLAMRLLELPLPLVPVVLGVDFGTIQLIGCEGRGPGLEQVVEEVILREI